MAISVSSITPRLSHPHRQHHQHDQASRGRTSRKRRLRASIGLTQTFRRRSKRTQAPVLFFHGEQDRWLSPEHSRALLSVAPAGSRLELAPLDNHLSLPLHFEKFAPAVIDWFDAGLH